MDFAYSTTTSAAPATRSAIIDGVVSPDEHCITAASEDNERPCWGCGLRLLVSPYAPAFRCAWCGAITNDNVIKSDNKCFKWKRLRDRCFVIFLILFMVFIISSLHFDLLVLLPTYCGVAILQWERVDLRTTHSVTTAQSRSPLGHIIADLVGCVFWTWIITAHFVSVEIGLSMLLWQQLWYIYQGKTYLSHLSSGGDETTTKGWENVIRFFGCPYGTKRYLPMFVSSIHKIHKK
ncbi:unnamed protein product [Cuscuta epithymum]|uniref:Protein S-acyltransferase n=1 Tax=Cuscuta epithymum TaxID=186058 RepID=A0AAV0FPL3_9ASTE|nr:unnamed protein product [Cuscuta epithymum]